MKKILLASCLLAALASCKKDTLISNSAEQGANTTLTPIEGGVNATTYDWVSKRPYNSSPTNGEYKNFTWGSQSAAFAHNVDKGYLSKTGYQTLSGNLPYTINGYSYTDMKLNIYHPGGGALPFPKTKKNYNLPYSNVKTLTSYVNMTLPAYNSNMQYNAAYDIYFDYPAYQGSFANYLAMMVWLYQEGPYGPAGGRLRWGTNGSQNVFTSKNGIQYKLIGRLNYSGHARIINFVTMNRTNTLSVDLKELMDFIHNTDFQYTEGNGSVTTIKTNLYGATLQDINIGWEIHKAFSGTNSPVDFYINNYRCDMTKW